MGVNNHEQNQRSKDSTMEVSFNKRKVIPDEENGNEKRNMVEGEG